MKHLSSMETNLPPNISERILLFLSATFTSGSHHVRYCTNMEHVSVGKDYFKAEFKRQSAKGEKQEAAGRVISHPKRNLPQKGCSFNPEPLEPPEDQKHMRVSFICWAGKARIRNPLADFLCLRDLLGHCSVCQFRAKDVKQQTLTI